MFFRQLVPVVVQQAAGQRGKHRSHRHRGVHEGDEFFHPVRLNFRHYPRVEDAQEVVQQKIEEAVVEGVRPKVRLFQARQNRAFVLVRLTFTDQHFFVFFCSASTFYTSSAARQLFVPVLKIRSDVFRRLKPWRQRERVRVKNDAQHRKPEHHRVKRSPRTEINFVHCQEGEG